MGGEPGGLYSTETLPRARGPQPGTLALPALPLRLPLGTSERKGKEGSSEQRGEPPASNQRALGASRAPRPALSGTAGPQLKLPHRLAVQQNWQPLLGPWGGVCSEMSPSSRPLPGRRGARRAPAQRASARLILPDFHAFALSTPCRPPWSKGGSRGSRG